MFKCAINGQVSKPGEKPVRVVLETRPKIYYKRVKTKEKDEFGVPIFVDQQIGEGFEIVKEILVRHDALEALKK